MGSYQIRVNVEIVETSEQIDSKPVKMKEGGFKFNISEAEATSIDKNEKAFLRVTHETVRDAISGHLTEVSRKKALEQGNDGEVVPNAYSYEVDGEVGRFSFVTHSIEKDRKVIYNTATSIFTELKGKEKYKTSGFKEIAMIYGTTEESYRKAADLINRIRYQDGATPMRTLQDNTEREGVKVIDFIEWKVTKIFQEKNFTEEGTPKNPSEEYPKEAVLLPEEEVKKAIEACKLSPEEQKEVERNPVAYEDPEQTVNLSADDVGVKKQKEERGEDGKNGDESEKKEYVQNTVIHIQKRKSSYVINGDGITATMRVVIGFLLNNDLLKCRLQFFVDGQKTLQSTILKMLSWHVNMRIILDWYHLLKKCKEKLSSAMKGRKIRNEILKKLMRFLWHGMVDKAIKYLNDLDEDMIKDRSALIELITYIERNRPYIPCYSVRKKLGLRNSSNIGEKMNDILVSDRQKHNGMSWSKAGSVTLASLTGLKRNKEHKKWFEEGDLGFELVA